MFVRMLMGFVIIISIFLSWFFIKPFNPLLLWFLFRIDCLIWFLFDIWFYVRINWRAIIFLWKCIWFRNLWFSNLIFSFFFPDTSRFVSRTLLNLLFGQYLIAFIKLQLRLNNYIPTCFLFDMRLNYAFSIQINFLLSLLYQLLSSIPLLFLSLMSLLNFPNLLRMLFEATDEFFISLFKFFLKIIDLFIHRIDNLLFFDIFLF